MSNSNHPSSGTAELVALLRTRREAGDKAASNRLFNSLCESVRPTLRSFSIKYSKDSRRTGDEVENDCLLCLSDCVDRYTLETAAQVTFESYLGMNLRKRLSNAYQLARAPLSGAGVKLMRKVSTLAQKARADGVDVSDTQAICDHAVANGARRTLVRRQLPLLAGVISLHTPVRHAKSGGESQILDFIAEPESESDSQFPPELSERALNLLLALPASQRLVLERRYGLSGHDSESYAAIARTEGVAACSIAERHERGVKQLRKAFGGTHHYSV